MEQKMWWGHVVEKIDSWRIFFTFGFCVKDMCETMEEWVPRFEALELKSNARFEIRALFRVFFIGRRGSDIINLKANDRSLWMYVILRRDQHPQQAYLKFHIWCSSSLAQINCSPSFSCYTRQKLEHIMEEFFTPPWWRRGCLEVGISGIRVPILATIQLLEQY